MSKLNRVTLLLLPIALFSSPTVLAAYLVVVSAVKTKLVSIAPV